jgi:hypothetical protein
MLTLLYVIPWIFVLIAVGITLGTALFTGPRVNALPPVVETAVVRAGDALRAMRRAVETRRRYRTFDRALAEFRRNAPVCAQNTMDDIVGSPRD